MLVKSCLTMTEFFGCLSKSLTEGMRSALIIVEEGQEFPDWVWEGFEEDGSDSVP